MAKLTLEDLERMFDQQDTFKSYKQVEPLKIDQSGVAAQIEEYQKQRFLQEKMKFKDMQREMFKHMEELDKKNKEIQREFKLREKLGKARDTEAGKVLFDEPPELKMSGMEGWLLDQKDIFK